MHFLKPSLRLIKYLLLKLTQDGQLCGGAGLRRQQVATFVLRPSCDVRVEELEVKLVLDSVKLFVTLEDRLVERHGVTLGGVGAVLDPLDSVQLGPERHLTIDHGVGIPHYMHGVARAHRDLRVLRICEG